MTNSPKILGFAGSARSDSFNKKLVKVALKGAEAAGAQITFVDFKDLPMPLYDQDLEQQDGLPENALKLKALMKEHQGFLIACPEYNSSITPLLKNAIDWASRSEPGEPPLALTCFKGKVAALLSASPGGLGGMRGLVHVRSILSSIGVLVIPEQQSVSGVMQAFDDQGNLQDDGQRESVEAIGARLAEVVAKLSA